MNINIDVSIHKYKSAKSIIYSYYCFKKDISLDTRVQSKNITDSNKLLTVREVIKLVEEKKHWGFCHHNPEELHLWFDKTSTFEQALNLISHEISHAVGFKKEKDAIKIGAITNFSLYILKNKFKYIKESN